MFSFGKKLPANWPSAFHHKCNNSKCTYPNSPKPTSGSYKCHGCSKGTYKVSRSTAAEIDAKHRQVFPLYSSNTRPTQHDPVPISAHAFSNAMVRPRAVPMRTVSEIRTMKALDSWDEPLARSNAVRKRAESKDSQATTSSSSSGSYGSHTNYYHSPAPAIPRGYPQPPPPRAIPTVSQQYYARPEAQTRHRNAPSSAPRPSGYQYRVYNQ
ncbi:hypothetical protein PQX77_010085 [Marasmius sp. AFHP31]|nr:hypothetical protein PQX77_010085 [Marasmius sp. AFHP31]